MNKKYLNIHLEGMDDNGQKLQRLLSEDIPCAISIAPETLRKGGMYATQYPYLPGFVDLIGELVNKSGNILGQQGNMHKCGHRHLITDSYHENRCPYHKSLSVDEQREIMQKGRETLIKLLGKKPEMYVPPNHLFDLNTLDAACLEDYDFFTMRGIKTLNPLLHKMDVFHPKNLLIVPEVKLKQKGHFFYIHYDNIEKNKQEFEEVVKNASSFHNIGIGFSMKKYFVLTNLGPQIDRILLAMDQEIIEKNIEATDNRKILRDIKNLPKRLLGTKWIQIKYLK